MMLSERFAYLIGSKFILLLQVLRNNFKLRLFKSRSSMLDQKPVLFEVGSEVMITRVINVR